MAQLMKKILAGICALALSASAHALKGSSDSVSVGVGASTTVTLSSVSGTVSFNNSNTSLVSVTKVSTYSYRLNGYLAGSAKITFRDKKGSATVAVTVTSSAPAPLNGRLLSSNCFQCHGTNGSGGFDKLAGMSEASLLDELRKFAQGKEDPTEIMAAHAMGYTDAQLQSIAKYFSKLN